MRIALGQMRVEGGEVAANLGRAERMIAEAAGAGAEMIVLPECLDCGWTDPSARHLAEPIPGRSSDRLAAAARSAGIYVVAGLTERAGDRIHNAAVFLGPDGEILWKHRKINILDIARDLYAVGDRIGAVDTPFGKIGLDICADNFFGTLQIGRSVGLMGARLLVSPSSWAVPANDFNADQTLQFWGPPYTALAREFQMGVIGVTNVGWIRGGPWAGKKCIGGSLAFAPDGTLLHRCAYGVDAETLDVIEMDFSPA